MVISYDGLTLTNFLTTLTGFSLGWIISFFIQRPNKKYTKKREFERLAWDNMNYKQKKESYNRFDGQVSSPPSFINSVY